MKRTLFLIPLLLAGAPLAAQTVTAAQCDSAIRIVRGQRLFAAEDTTGIWWNFVSTCGDAGERSAADALRSTVVRRETDPDRYREFFVLFGGRRSAVLFAAYKDLLEDESASTPMRLESMRELGWMKLPGFRWDGGGFDMKSIQRLPSSVLCGSTRDVITMDGEESNLPTDFVKKLIELMHAQEARRANDSLVRVQAHCWRVALEQTLPPDPHKITLKHVCGRDFTVTNDNPVPVIAALEVVGTAERHVTTVGGASSTTMGVFARGDVRLLFGSLVVDRSSTSRNDDDCVKKKP